MEIRVLLEDFGPVGLESILIEEEVEDDGCDEADGAERVEDYVVVVANR